LRYSTKTAQGFARATIVALVIAWGLLLIVILDLAMGSPLGFKPSDILPASLLAAGATLIRIIGMFFIKLTGG
jgi:hypothetical protein